MMPIAAISTIELPTERLLLRPPKPEDALDLLHYYHANRDHLRPWEPQHPDDFYTLPKLQQSLIDRVEAMEKGHAIHWLLIGRKSVGLQGECNVTAIIRGPFQACYLGFSIAQGQGLMHEALSTAIDFIFRGYRLNRIMANYRPENRRCGQLLARLGFEIEGKARAYLKINGLWEDHLLTSRINSNAL
ncbi:GNAT family N-acetyltransferase [unidentified bacterial endosymbiont]|uniref:GNAT family N-acetyltransferase n=1 Tax=unidentified bacterial endosymbiont TaxID=2355 RepID=UPI00209EDA8D|nr:GNAT family N-acetyltransferase [unidentified bacterial endosymbiont]